MAGFVLVLSAVAVVAFAIPEPEVVLSKSSEEQFQYIYGLDGTPHLVDTWAQTSDLQEEARFDPDRQNVYHLFTRQNPTVSQPLLFGLEDLLLSSNYNPLRRTVILVHGWLESVTAAFNTVMIPAYLESEDVNVISADWSAGAGNNNYYAAVTNTVTSGESVARFINWLNSVTGAVPDMYHLVGFSLGAHQVGVIGRNVNGNIAYITALDPPSPGWITNRDKFSSSDGEYTEVIHTSAGRLGYISTLGDVDFYPNGGSNMPGCILQQCDHARSYFYMAESVSSGGFTGQRCSSYLAAMAGTCFLEGSLKMGGVVPKTGSSGVYYLRTNSAPPFSRD